MNATMQSAATYRIEVSGWGLDNNFFVERTDLICSQDGEKKVRLRRSLADGVIIFVRLLVPESTGSSLPIPYQVKGAHPMDCNGHCEIHLTRLHPRAQESIAPKTASYKQERLSRVREPIEGSTEPEPGETIQ